MSRSSAFANTQHLNQLSFSMTDSTEFIPNSKPSLIQSNKRVPFFIEDIATVWPDHLTHHFADRFHDPTVFALHQGKVPVPELLQNVQFVSDRKSLRRLVVNNCVTLPPKPFYCKKETFVLLAEKINGTVFLGGETRFEPAPGSYGQGFEEAMTQHFHRGNTADITTDYCIVKYSLMGEVGCLIRYEADGCNARGEVEELKCKKRPNPRYGLGEEFFLNMWIQMSLSQTQKVHIGLHRDGRVDEIMSLTLDQVQANARITAQAAALCWSTLQRTLSAIHKAIPEGRKGRLTCREDGHISFSPTSAPVPLLSPAARTILCPVIEPVHAEIMVPADATASVPTARQEVATSSATTTAAGSQTSDAATTALVDDLLSVFDRATSLAGKAT